MFDDTRKRALLNPAEVRRFQLATSIVRGNCEFSEATTRLNANEAFSRLGARKKSCASLRGINGFEKEFSSPIEAARRAQRKLLQYSSLHSNRRERASESFTSSNIGRRPSLVERAYAHSEQTKAVLGIRTARKFGVDLNQ